MSGVKAWSFVSPPFPPLCPGLVPPFCCVRRPEELSKRSLGDCGNQGPLATVHLRSFPPSSSLASVGMPRPPPPPMEGGKRRKRRKKRGEEEERDSSWRLLVLPLLMERDPT